MILFWNHKDKLTRYSCLSKTLKVCETVFDFLISLMQVVSYQYRSLHHEMGFKFITELTLVNKSQYTDLMIHNCDLPETKIFTHICFWCLNILLNDLISLNGITQFQNNFLILLQLSNLNRALPNKTTNLNFLLARLFK